MKGFIDGAFDPDEPITIHLKSGKVYVGDFLSYDDGDGADVPPAVSYVDDGFIFGHNFESIEYIEQHGTVVTRG